MRLAVRVVGQLEEMPKRARTQMLRRLRGLASDPRPAGATRLRGSDQWRIRVGDYRAIYDIRDRVLLVLVVKIGHRRDVYRSK